MPPPICGSATAGKLHGGVGMVVTEGDPANPTTRLTKQQRRAAITSSYDEEKPVMCMAPAWLLPSHEAAATCTGSQSLLKAECRDASARLDAVLLNRLRAGHTPLLKAYAN